MVDLQNQALSKCVSATTGARKVLVSQVTGIESPWMALDAAQARLMDKMMTDPAVLGDL